MNNFNEINENGNKNVNNYSNKLSKSVMKVTILVIVFVIGMIMFSMIVSFGTLNSISNSYSEKEDMYDEKTTAIIESIQKDENSGSFDVNIVYSVDGTIYSGKLNYYNSKMYKGQKIEISYKSENPEEYYSNPFSSEFGINSVLLICSFVAPLIIILISIILILSSRKRKKNNNINRNSKLKKTGIRLIGTIQDIEIISSRDGSESMRRIICTYTNLQGKTVTVKSDPVYDSIEMFFRERGVRTVDVYVDQNNDNYFIDVESIKR